MDHEAEIAESIAHSPSDVVAAAEEDTQNNGVGANNTSAQLVPPPIPQSAKPRVDEDDEDVAADEERPVQCLPQEDSPEDAVAEEVAMSDGTEESHQKALSDAAPVPSSPSSKVASLRQQISFNPATLAPGARRPGGSSFSSNPDASPTTREGREALEREQQEHEQGQEDAEFAMAAAAAGGAKVPPPHPPPSRPHKPPPPAPRRLTEAEVREQETIRYYLKQAVGAKSYDAIGDLVAKAQSLHMPHDGLMEEAAALLRDHDDQEREHELETVKFYLRQALDSRRKESLTEIVAKADRIKIHSRLNSDFVELLTEAKQAILELDRQSVDTIQSYLKQGIQLRNRDLLKGAMDKANELKPGTIDPELLKKASEVLQRLDAENLMLFYLDNAIKQKDFEALESCMVKVRALGISSSHEKVKEGEALLKQLQKKNKGSRGKKGTFKNLDKVAAAGGPRYFGADLQSAVQRSPYIVPKVMYLCVEFIRQNGLQQQGLFRLAGHAENTSALRKSLENDEEVKFEDINDTAGVLRQYLRQLPEPLIPFSLYPTCIQIADQFKPNDPQRLDRIKEVMDKLPPSNLDCLAYLIYFLHECSTHADESKMNASNLAIVFAPNILRPIEETPQSMLTEMNSAIQIISSMIEHPTRVLKPPPESMQKPVL